MLELIDKIYPYIIAGGLALLGFYVRYVVNSSNEKMELRIENSFERRLAEFEGRMDERIKSLVQIKALELDAHLKQHISRELDAVRNEFDKKVSEFHGALGSATKSRFEDLEKFRKELNELEEDLDQRLKSLEQGLAVQEQAMKSLQNGGATA